MLAGQDITFIVNKLKEAPFLYVELTGPSFRCSPRAPRFIFSTPSHSISRCHSLVRTSLHARTKYEK